jgi:hypothetical protein
LTNFLLNKNNAGKVPFAHAPRCAPAQSAAVLVAYQTTLQALKVGGILVDNDIGDNTEKSSHGGWS